MPGSDGIAGLWRICYLAAEIYGAQGPSCRDDAVILLPQESALEFELSINNGSKRMLVDLIELALVLATHGCQPSRSPA